MGNVGDPGIANRIGAGAGIAVGVGNSVAGAKIFHLVGFIDSNNIAVIGIGNTGKALGEIIEGG